MLQVLQVYYLLGYIYQVYNGSKLIYFYWLTVGKKGLTDTP